MATHYMLHGTDQLKDVPEEASYEVIVDGDKAVAYISYKRDLTFIAAKDGSQVNDYIGEDDQYAIYASLVDAATTVNQVMTVAEMDRIFDQVFPVNPDGTNRFRPSAWAAIWADATTS